MQLCYLTDELTDFPPITNALSHPNGLLAVGGSLTPQRLMKAYQSGIFPWNEEDDPILWWSPDPRAVLYPEEFHISRSFNRFLKKTNYRLTLNFAFKEVIEGCAERPKEGTWITGYMQKAYYQLHRLGFAHSFEVWQENQLIGGLYGIAQGKVFCGESMFSRRENASKCALLTLCRYWQQQGGELIDCQILNPHTASLGACEIGREQYLTELYYLQKQSLSKDTWLSKDLTFLIKNFV